MSPDESLSRRDTGTEATSDPRRPWWPVGLALLGLVAVVLVGAVLLDRQLRPRVGVDPTPAVPAAAQTPSVLPSPTALTTASPTVSGVATVPTATATLPGVRVATSPLEREIEDAYYRYLQVYSDAVLNLDTSRLSEVLDGEALRSVAEEVDDRKASGRPLKVIEDDRLIAFGPVTETQASLIDEYTSRSVVVDANTKQPLPRTSPPTRIRQTYVFRKLDGTWKIVDGTREILGEANR